MKVAQEFAREYPVMIEGQHNPNYAMDIWAEFDVMGYF
jgi:hypothetical protein